MSTTEQSEPKPPSGLGWFSDEVYNEAIRLRLKDEVFKGRRRVDGSITIDPTGSRDKDDAIGLKRLDSGAFLIEVSIADPSVLIEPNSYTDLEAYKRAFTRYRGRGNTPMIPRPLSEDRLSLLPQGSSRPTLTVTVPISSNGEIGDNATVKRTFIQNPPSLSYEEAEAGIDDPASPNHSLLKDANIIANILLANRRQKGALAIYDINSGWATDEDGNLVKLDRGSAHRANIIIQEFMILANTKIAQFASESDTPILYRNHRARASAPQRAEILEDIETSIAFPNAANVNTLRRRINLTMERAFYGPTLRGHFGLNEAAYSHFTSPLRRYADMLVHRQLIAAIEERRLPYDSVRLGELAEHLNAVENSIKDERRKAFREQSTQKTLDELDQDREKVLANLPTRKFYRLVESGGGVGQTKEEGVAAAPGFKEALQKRIEDGKLSARDVYFLLFEADATETDFADLKNYALNAVFENPTISPEVMNLLFQAGKVGGAKYGMEQSKEGNDTRFKVTGKLRVGEEIIQVDSGKFANVKAARHDASRRLLLHFLGHEGESAAVESSKPVVESRPLNASTPKGDLNTYCQVEKIELPTYELTASGKDHNRTFYCKVSITRDGVVYTSDEVSAATKKEAEQLAASSLINKLGIEVSAETSSVAGVISAPEIKGDGNFVSSLGEFASKNSLSQPSYEIAVSGTPHSPTITCRAKFTLATGEVVEAEVSGPNKKVARQQAAEIIIKQITGSR